MTSSNFITIFSYPSLFFSKLPEHCCNIPEFFDDADLIKCKNSQGTESLLRPIGPIDGGRKKRFATSRMELGTCYLDCVFQSAGVKTGQMLDTNKLLQKLASETPTEQESTNVITSSVTQCIQELNSGTLKVRSSANAGCNSIPASLMICIHQKFFLSCPSNRFNNIQACQTLREYLRRCPITL
jgi:hypothetical protein